jgi:hypothetical protein
MRQQRAACLKAMIYIDACRSRNASIGTAFAGAPIETIHLPDIGAATPARMFADAGSVPQQAQFSRSNGKIREDILCFADRA